MNISLLTLGCKVNQAESSRIAAEFLANGWKEVDLEGHPDLCIINTCSVTSKSDYQSRQLIRRAAKTGSRVIVTGCYSELNGESVRSMDGVAMVVPNNEKELISRTLGNFISCKYLIPRETLKSRYFVKVQDGCNNTCTYCVIPRARGRSRSREANEVIEEIKSISHFYNEAVITGIHLGTYGYDLIPKVSLPILIRGILLKTDIKRIRLSSLEINEIDEELIELLQEERVCKHLHIPLQSGDDKILGLMNRNYNISQFKAKLSLILRKLPGISIGTDIIVGFPGEEEKEFENTRKFLDDSPISYVHAFPFSPRKGTEAYEMKASVNDFTKKTRCEIVRSVGRRKNSEYLISQIGKILDLLIERIEDDGRCAGTTGNYLRARAYLKAPRAKDIVRVRIEQVKDDALIGYPIELP